MLAVVFALDAIVLTALRIGASASRHREPFGASLAEWAMGHPGTVTLVSLVTGGFIGAAALTRHLQLRDGGGYVARSVGGVRVDRNTPDVRRRRLHNIVEEMALASGIPVPEVYVVERDDGINAFAAGHTPSNAAIAVTRGALLNLNREQLQGVIAHEFSHILNGDMRLSMRLMSMVFGLMAVALAGRLLIRLAASGGGSRRDRSAAPVLMLGIGVAIIGQVGFWSGRILQAWISRRRESLADASAVQFTRNPQGLRDALLRIAAQARPHERPASGMEEIAHMLLVPETTRLLATHPPMQERVRELDPQVTPERFASLVRQAREQMARERSTEVAASANTDAASPLPLPASNAVPAAPAFIAASSGDPAPAHLAHAVAVRRALPDALRASAEQPERAQALLLAMLVAADRDHWQQRIEFVGTKLGEPMAHGVRNAVNETARLDPMLRLPAVLQLMPALRTLPAADRALQVATMRELMRVDGSISVFEYALEKLASRALLPREGARNPHGRLTLEEVAASLGIVFAVLARQGTPDDEMARRAYEAGLASLLPRHRPAYCVIGDWVAVFDSALDQLCQLRVTAKQMLIQGLVRTIAHDELLSPAEAELLRAICAVLECPLPPVLPPLPAPGDAATSPAAR
jgi:Zn-dependent protease with chaperone function